MPVVAPLQPAVHDAVLAWYRAEGRSLPFRGTRDPYAILVSELMAQQTQAHRAGEAWRRFLARFPTVASGAAATPAGVLRAGRGPGFARRGPHPRRTVRTVVGRPGRLLR